MINLVLQIIKNHGKKKSALKNISLGIPPLLKAEKIQGRIKKNGFDLPDFSRSMDKIKEVLGELLKDRETHLSGKYNREKIEDEFGDLLFSIVNLAGHFNIDPAGSLERTNLKFMNRFGKMEEMLESGGKTNAGSVHGNTEVNTLFDN